MPRNSFQDPKLKQTVLANLDSHERKGIRISLFPNGGLCLEPGGWPDGKTTGNFDGPILLNSRRAEALQRFFNGSHVQDRMLDVNRRRLLRNPATRELIQWIDRMMDEQEHAAA